MHYIITPFQEFNELCIGVNLDLCADVNMHNNRRMWSSEFTAARVVWSIATSLGLNKLQPKKAPQKHNPHHNQMHLNEL